MFVLLNYFVFLGLMVRIATSNNCICNNTVTPPFDDCSSISDAAGSVCYGSTQDKTICALVSCTDGTTYERECTDKPGNAQGHGTWTGLSECVQASTSSIQTTTTHVPTTQTGYESTSSTSSVSSVVTTPITGTTIATSIEITPTTSTAYTTLFNESTPSSSSAVTSVSSTSIQVTSTEHDTSQYKQTSDDNVAVYVSVPIVIIITTIIVVIIVIIFLRRRARAKGASSIKEPLHGSFSNTSYPHHELTDNIIPMTNLEPEAQNSTYAEITDVETRPVNTTDDHYNTISIPPSNEYDHLKPLAKPIVDNTYSHANKSKTVDNIYNHTEKTADQITIQESKDNDDSYSHLGKDFVPQEKKQPVVEGDSAYNTLNTKVNTSLQHKTPMKNDDSDKDTEYNHLTTGQQTAPNNITTDTKGTDSCLTQAPLHDADTVQGSTVPHQYDQVVEDENKAKEDEENNGQKRAFKIADDRAESDADNDSKNHSYFVLEAENDENAEDDSTETDHQYSILEKHEKE